MFLRALALAAVLLSSIQAASNDELRIGFLSLCDTDKSGLVDARELSRCFNQVPLHDGATHPSADVVLNLADKDRDGLVSGDEYLLLLSSLGEDKQNKQGFATLRARDGTERQLSRKELEGLMQQSDALQAQIKNPTGGGGIVGGGAIGSGEKRRSLEEIAAQDPEMAKFIAVAQWAVDQLKSRGNVFEGPPLQLRSLPPGGSNLRDKAEAAAIDWGGTDHADMWFEFSTAASATAGDQGRLYYEIHVERNAAIYRRPYLALRGAWQLEEKSMRRLRELPLPKPRMSRSPVAPGEINQDEGEMRALAVFPAIALLLLLVWSVRGFVADWMDAKERRRRLDEVKKNS